MDERTQDTITRRDELQALLGCGDTARLLQAGRNALLALEFRAADRMLGLPPVDRFLVEELQSLIVKVLEEASQLGSEDAAFTLSQVQLDRGDAEAALAAMIPLAEAGHPRASAAAAEIVWRAELASRYPDATRWLANAASADENGIVHYMQALFAFHGFGRAEDRTEALRLHEEAAARGHADAMFELYAMLWQGQGRPADPEKAVAWCVKSAEAGNARAMANLGSFHATGSGVPKDPARSVEWYDRAAQAGHGKAAATLGCMFAAGQEVERDEEKARGYFARADELGFDWRRLAEVVGLDPAEWA
jgi:hypothetical protein